MSLGKATVWHEGTQSFYTADLIKKMTKEEVQAEVEAAAGELDPGIQKQLKLDLIEKAIRSTPLTTALSPADISVLLQAISKYVVV